MESVHQAKVVHTQIRNPLPLYQKEPNKLSISTTSFLAKASLNNQFTPPPQPPPVVTIFLCFAPSQVLRWADSGGSGSADFRGPLRFPRGRDPALGGEGGV